MEPLVYVMAILGCSESDAACHELRIVETRYATEAECVAATGLELLRHDDVPYPTVVAQCRRGGTAVQVLRGSEVMMPDGGALPAEAPRIADARPARPTPRR